MSPVVLYYASDTAPDLASHVQALARQGYELRHCPDTAALRSHIRLALSESSHSSDPVMAVLAASGPHNRAAASILAAVPQIGVLARLDACDDATLAATLQLGIDTWCPRDCSPDVLALALHGLKRRLEHYAPGAAEYLDPVPPVAPLPGVPQSQAAWALRDHAWLLETPAGQQVRLTSSERTLMLGLVGQAEKAVSHVELLRALGRPAPESREARMGLGVLVSRLRRKVSGHGAELPVQSLHNWGYMFAAKIELHDGAEP